MGARVLLDTVERSPNDGEIVLSSGVTLRSDDRPKGNFFDKVWSNLMEARAARARVQLPNNVRDHLCAALLAGGGDTDGDGMPPGLAAAVKSYEELPKPTHLACQEILRPLIAISVECSRKDAFKNKLLLTIDGITADDGSLYLEVAKAPVPVDTDIGSLLDSDSDLTD